ncbi:amidohydrolase family protein [Vallitalea okinawensis]|uniref:amidohydrolase family protein n=1 Tax=Vallitalea okinawensis TaxID=2078660 RepID=UPI001FA8B51F|nr:amidohydrolase family protein [Vallitalea okinawensis]
MTPPQRIMKEGTNIMYALINVRMYDFDHYREDAYILFDDKIQTIGDMCDFKDDDYDIIDGTHQLVMPSLVVAHTHIYSTFARGLSLQFHPTNFQELLDQLWWKLDAQLELEEIYYSGLVSGVDYIKNGVTTLIDHHASGLAIKGSLNALKKAVCDDIGMRGIFCFETSDRFDTDECIKENIDFNQAHKAKNCIGLFGLHASMSLSDKTLEKVRETSGEIPIHIHVAESEMDQEDCLAHYGERVVERLHRHQLLKENSILSHCIHINEEEAELITKSGAYVALNVTSNMNNGVGLPDYLLLNKKGIKCLIGNDGIASSITTEWLNLYYSMHLRYQSPTAFGFEPLIQIIQNNYKYVNQAMGIQIGKLKEGYDADLLMIPYIPPTPMDGNNAFGHLFFGLANSFKPKHVWCMGKQLLKDYQVDEDLEERYKEASEVAINLWEKVNNSDE